MQIKIMKVPVVFEVEFNPASADQVPCLVGSLEELGTWNRRNAVMAKKNHEDATKWTVELEVPQMSFFFFNWAMTRNGQFYEEERTGCRKANVGVFGGVFKSEYGEKWTEFSSFFGCQISVSTHYVPNYDEQIVLMGSGDILGNWKTWVPAASDDACVWTTKFELEQGTAEEFKWVILDRQTREIRRWQDGENRIIRVESGLKEKSVFLPWGGRLVKEGLTIPNVTVEDCSEYHPQSLSESFDIDCIVGDDDDINMDDTNLDLVQKIPSLGNEQEHLKINEKRKPGFTTDFLAGGFGSKDDTRFNLVRPRNFIIPKKSSVLNVFNIKHNFPCFSVDLLDDISCIDIDVILQLVKLVVTCPVPQITPCNEDKKQLELPQNFPETSPEIKETSSSAVKLFFSHDRTIVSRTPILTDLLERVIGLGGRLDQNAVGRKKKEITYSNEMVTDLQNNHGSYHGNVKDANTGVWLSTVNFAKAIVLSSSQQFPFELVRDIIKNNYTQEQLDEYNKNIEVSCGVGGLLIAVIIASYGGYCIYYMLNRKRSKYTGQKPLLSGKKLNILMVFVVLTTIVQFIFVICIMTVNSKINDGINNVDDRVTNAMDDTTQYFQQTHKQYDFMTKDSIDWFTSEVLEEDFTHLGDLIWQPGHRSFYPTVSPIYQQLDDIDKYISNSKQLLSNLNNQIRDLTTGLGLIVRSNLTTAHTNLTLIRGDWTCIGCDGSCTGCQNIIPGDIFPFADFFALPNLTSSTSNISEITREPFQGSSRSPEFYFMNGIGSVIQDKLKDNITDLLRRANDYMITVKMSTSPLRYPTDKDLYFDTLRPQFHDFHQRIENGNDLRSGFTWFFTTINILVIIVVLAVLVFILSRHYKHCRTLMVIQEDNFILPRKILLGCCIGCIVLCISYIGLAMAGFYIGANLERVFCQTSKDYSIAQHVLDVPNTVPGHPGYFMASVVLGNGSLVLKLSDMLRQCKENEPGFEALKQNQIIPDIKQHLDIQQKLGNIEAIFDSMYIDLENVTLVPSDLQSWLGIFNTSTDIQQTPFLDLFNKTIVKADLDSYIANLKIVSNTPESAGGPVNPSKRLLLVVADYLTTIKPLVVQLANRKDYLEELYNNFQSNVTVVKTKLANVIDQLLDTEELFWNKSSNLIKQGVDELRSDYKEILPEFTDISSSWMTHSIGMCRPLSKAYESVVYGFCDKIADFENAQWLLNGINGVILLVLSLLILFIYKSLIVDTTHNDDINANFEKIFGTKKQPKEQEGFLVKAAKKLKKKSSIKKSYSIEKTRGRTASVTPVLSLHDIDHNSDNL